MTTLHLGVIEQNYAYEREQVSKRGKVLKKKLKVSSSITTFEVATFLEEKYGIMQAFYDTNQVHIGEMIADGLAGHLESVIMGAPVSDPYASATQEIDAMFKDFITTGQAERVGIPGAPTAAALKGISHRKAHPYAKANARRESFRDTGLYQASFKSWVDN